MSHLTSHLLSSETGHEWITQKWKSESLNSVNKAWWILDKLKVASVHKRDSSMKASQPSLGVGSLLYKRTIQPKGMWDLFSCAKATQGGALS